MKKKEIIMLSSTVFSLGIVLGILISPIKKGIIIIGGNSTSNNYAKEHSTIDDNNIHQ